MASLITGCKTCDSPHVKLTEPVINEAIKKQLEGERMLHQAKAERHNHTLSRKIQHYIAKSDPNVKAITCNLQQTLATPLIFTNVMF